MNVTKVAIGVGSTEDLIKVIAWASTNGYENFDLIGDEPRRKRPQFMKKCEFCGKEYKGKIGLGIHRGKCTKRVIA
jgi:hypothetical protein